VQVTDDDLRSVVDRMKHPLDVDKVWDMLDTDDTMAIDLTDCVAFVADTLRLRRDLTRTILDGRSILRHIDIGFTLCMVFVMCFVVLELYQIVRFKDMWQGFSAALIAFSFVFGNSIRQVWENLVYLFTVHAFDVGDAIIVNDARYTINSISISHVLCTRVDNSFVTIPLHTFVDRELYNVTRSGCKWEGFSMLVDVDTTKQQLKEVASELKAHIACNKRYYGGLYRIFFVPTDGIVHKLKLAVYFNYSRNEGDLMLIGMGRTLMHDVLARAMHAADIHFTLPDFANRRKSKSQAREMDHMDYQDYASTEDRLFNIGVSELG
jgi:small-conductance mechanosensitive channel